MPLLLVVVAAMAAHQFLLLYGIFLKDLAVLVNQALMVVEMAAVVLIRAVELEWVVAVLAVTLELVVMLGPLMVIPFQITLLRLDLILPLLLDNLVPVVVAVVDKAGMVVTAAVVVVA